MFSSSVESLHVAVTTSQVSETERSPEEGTEELTVKHTFTANEILETVPGGEYTLMLLHIQSAKIIDTGLVFWQASVV